MAQQVARAQDPRGVTAEGVRVERTQDRRGDRVGALDREGVRAPSPRRRVGVAAVACLDGGCEAECFRSVCAPPLAPLELPAVLA